ncbi:MAG TPA: hypothetical protein VFS71_19470 [Flavobacterium sp.]|uniref:hypothetical protein n=1 Tax=Flavobacterium sp. TaxID=239 RepID=UPI002DBA030D|nr:hypothetical protein [Flavobacterium sp.]HEU4791873.1 hypothetical protein [Flavobacterium sp.]
MKTKIFLITSFIAILFCIGCDSSDKTADETNLSTNNQIAVDSKIDASIEDVSNIAEDQFSVKQSNTARSSETMHPFLPSCAIVTWTYANGTFTGTIDFGTEGCALTNGNVLKGKITLSFSGNFTTSEQMITYSFDEFYHNGIKIQGSRTITRTLKSTELLAEVHPVFTNSVDITVTFEDGSSYTRTGNRTKEMIDGNDWEDRVFLVTGSYTTSKSNGDTWSCTIQTPLRYEMACKKSIPVSGTVLKVNNGVETVIDYGTGECDNLANVTTNGVTTTIELKR